MVSFRVRTLGIDSGKPIVVLTEDDAADLGVKSSSRVRVKSSRGEITAIVNIATKTLSNGTIGVFDEVRRILKLRDNDRVDVEVAPFPSSLQFIRNRLLGRKLNYDEIHEIVKDVVEGKLRETEIAS